MNDQIRKLALETDAYCDQHYLGNQFYEVRWEEKFAELIVKDCCQTMDCLLEYEGPGYSHISESILDRYGF